MVGSKQNLLATLPITVHIDSYLVLVSFINQGGDWEDVPSQKTPVVSGVLCITSIVVLVLTENVDCCLGPSKQSEVVHFTTSRDGNVVLCWA